MSDKPKELKIPGEVVESFARCILPVIKEYFESKEGQMEFEMWIAKKHDSAMKKVKIISLK